MKKYEILIIVDKDVQEEKREQAIGLVKSYITDNKGEVLDVDVWGMKRFAYPINFKNEGYYVLIKFMLDPSLLLELKRIMGLNEAFVREMITNVIENKKTLAPRKVRVPRKVETQSQDKDDFKKFETEEVMQEVEATKVEVEEAQIAVETETQEAEEEKA